MTNKPYRLGAHAVIFNPHNDVLLVQHYSYQHDQWNFPGGGREGHESAADNALREATEELGLTASDLQLIGVSPYPNQYDFPQSMIEANTPITHQYRGQHKDHVLFRLINPQATIRIDPREIRGYQWVPVGQLDQYLVFPNQFSEVLPTINHYLALAK